MLQQKFKDKKISLVLSGGAVKAAAYHLGVAKALYEQKIYPDFFIGSSAGSIVSTYLAADIPLDELIYAYTTSTSFFSKKKVPYHPISYFDMLGISPIKKITSFGKSNSMWSYVDPSLIAKRFHPTRLFKVDGLFNTNGIESYFKKLPFNFGDDFKYLKKHLYIVATELNRPHKAVFCSNLLNSSSPETTYYNDVPISKAIAASCAIPFLYEPVTIKHGNGESIVYTDGEVRDTLSTNIAIDLDADIIISSYTHQPISFSRNNRSLSNFGAPALITQALYQVIEKKISHQRQLFELQKNVIDSIFQSCKKQNLSDDIFNSIVMELEKNLSFNKNREFYWIHPKSSNLKMFFGDHFSLSKRQVKFFIETGYIDAQQKINTSLNT